ncbi:FecR domain-containing protein [Terasakiella sp. SH-1]|uniref:FecR family protein n=1 Tax=Terasakiella sp. SH-1 TaxID=2560057 RepID=UPI0010743281|nr:FecR domain-containing protein [Terasakiella sp. SH-1]
MKHTFIALFGCLVLIAFVAQAALTPNVAGKVKQVSGSVVAVQDAQVRVLKTGDEVLIGDILSTGPDGRLEITMIDEGSFKLGGRTSFVVIDYTFGQGNNNAVIELLNGAIDGVSGQIAKASAEGLRIETKAATIGIRGTKFFVGELDGALSVAHWKGGGVHVKNFAGEVTLTGNDSGTRLHDPHTAPTPSKMWGGEKKQRALALMK